MDPWSPEAAELPLPPIPPAPPKPRPKHPPPRGERLVAIMRQLTVKQVRSGLKIAKEIGCTPRTLYRDMGALREAGVPIEGQAGSGYTLRAGYMTPEISFTLDEVEAIAIGTRLVSAWGAGSVLARAADDAIAKIEAVLPRGLKPKAAPELSLEPQPDAKVAPLHALFTRAVRQRWLVVFDYLSASGRQETARVKPLSLVYWRGAWQVCVFDAVRAQFTSFRLDDIGEARLDSPFAVVQGERLEDFLRMLRVEKVWG
jgi:predicted DNA-binding transcriptional regulator YafY